MKKKLLVILILVMMSTGLYAQQVGQSTFGFRLGGARGLWRGLESEGWIIDSWSDWHGSSSSHWTVRTEWEESNRSNFKAVIYYAYTFRNNLSLQVELNVMVNQGIEVEMREHITENHSWWGWGWDNGSWDSGSWTDSWTTEWSETFTYTSIDIPILLRHNFFYGLLGFLIGPHISIPVAGDYINELNTTFGITIGGQGLFPIWGGRLVGDLRFIADFNRLVENDWDDGGIRRQALAITVGYEWSF